MSSDAHAAVMRCEDSTPGPQNNVFNISSRSTASTGDALCTHNGSSLDCNLSLCDSTSDENEVTMVDNSASLADSWVIQVKCDISGTRRTMCQIFEDTGFDVEQVTITGTAKSDWIGLEDTNGAMASFNPSFGPDIIVEVFGEGAHDILVGANTSSDHYVEKLHGGSGHDHLFSNQGSDFLFGDAGSDVLNGGNDIDTLEGGTELDWLVGGNQPDILRGEAGDDILCADEPVGMKPSMQGVFQTVYTGSENPNWTGWSGLQACDAVPTGVAGSTWEILDGGAGNDVLVAGEYMVRMKGGSGDDDGTGSDMGDEICDPNNETDVFRGGAGSNSYFIQSNSFGTGTWDNTGGGSGDACRTRGLGDITVINCNGAASFAACPF
jgi:hypothetical protein